MTTENPNQIQRTPQEQRDVKVVTAHDNVKAIAAGLGSATLLDRVIKRLPTRRGGTADDAKKRAETLLALLATEISRDSKLWLCDPDSAQRAAMQVVTLDMEPTRERGLLYVVSYNVNRGSRDNPDWRQEMQVQLGYRGMIHEATRSGSVKKIEAVPVYEGDHFEDRRGTNPEVIHVPNYKAERSAENLILIYAVATLPNGDHCVEVMTKSEIDEIRKRSKSADKGPWKTDYIEMGKKSVIRRLFKYLPTQVQLPGAMLQQIDTEDRVEYLGTAPTEASEPVQGPPSNTSRSDELLDELGGNDDNEQRFVPDTDNGMRETTPSGAPIVSEEDIPF